MIATIGQESAADQRSALDVERSRRYNGWEKLFPRTGDQLFNQTSKVSILPGRN